MAEENRKKLLNLLKENGNEMCADCQAPGPEWASYNIGIFLCTQCAGMHRKLGSHISKVKSLRLDNWVSENLQNMNEIGNLKAKSKYESDLPVCYQRPNKDSALVLREQWIRAKYERKEFIDVDKQTYTSGKMEGWLWKRGKEDGRFQLRKFVLSEHKNTLVYYVKEHHKEPKATLKISELNATFCPSKVGNLNGLQITYVRDGSTRNIFVYASDGKDIVDWYLAIRSAKLHYLQVAFPGATQEELVPKLTRDFLKEGWLWKTGPRGAEAYKRRWFTLDDRKLMYLDHPLDAYPKGEIFLGYRDGFTVRQGVPPGIKEQGFSFTLKTPYRNFLLGADLEDERNDWMAILQSVINRPLSPQDNNSLPDENDQFEVSL